MTRFSVYEFLKAKRSGEELPANAIAEFISGFNSGWIADYQMTAFLMAVAIRGMTAGETVALTQAMLNSGERWDLRETYDFVADKHSSGGVGDKVSLILTPWVAACGVKIGMLSGRGLGHTGGTLDKLESIPGFNARLTQKEFERCLNDVGGAIATSTSGIAPADRRMYALRDVTATVESLPLITASIMSKKLAAGASALILDVKYGRGAFMERLEDARALAKSLIAAARGSGTVVEALITDMNTPLGATAGNANEVIECVAALRGQGPADLYEVTKAQAVRVLVMSGRFDETTADAALEESIRSGAAIRKTAEWIKAQGGDPSFIDDPKRLPQPRASFDVRSTESGVIQQMDTRGIGLLAVELGAGRMRADDRVDHSSGIVFHRKTGDRVETGEPVATIQLGAKTFDREDLAARYLDLLEISDEPVKKPPLIEELIRDTDA